MMCLVQRVPCYTRRNTHVQSGRVMHLGGNRERECEEDFDLFGVGRLGESHVSADEGHL